MDDVQRWNRVREVFEACVALEGSAREERLVDECGSDEGLAEEVRRLLAEDVADDYLEPPDRDAILTTEGADRPGQRVGPYLLERLIGRGGMGSVYLASRQDEHFEQRVAVKLIRRGMDTDDVLGRFRKERQVLADLAHPGIARLLDGGATEDGRPYLVMEYVDGERIDRYCDEHRLEVSDRLRLFVKVCAAVEHAHRNGIVHRDLKPGNVLVSPAGDPKLLDFGIAKLVESEGEDATVTAQRFLTPDYASPEQFAGDTITPASDVWSLGVVLYELLTDHRPFDRATTAATGRAQPPRPSQVVRRTSRRGKQTTLPEEIGERRRTTTSRLRSRLSGDLDTILQMTLREEPERRYASAGVLGEDLERHLADQPIRARPDGLAYRASKFVRRHRAETALAVLFVVALGILSLLQRTWLRDGALLPNTLAVVPFEAPADSPEAVALARTLFHTLPEVLGTADVEVLSPGFLADRAKELELAAGESVTGEIDARIGQAVAREVGATWFVAGTIIPRMRRFDVRCEVREVATGKLLGASVQIYVPADRIHEFVGALAREVHTALGMTQPERGMSALSVSSLALRAFAEGLASMGRGDFVEAEADFAEAIAGDPDFALAHFYRAWALAWRDEGSDLAPAAAALEQALLRSSQLSPLDREKAELLLELVRGYWFPRKPGLLKRARELAALHPRDKEAAELWLEFAHHHPIEGRATESIEAAEAILAIDSHHVSAHVHLLFAARFVDRPDLERRAAEGLLRFATDSGYRSAALLVLGDVEAAVDEAARLAEESRSEEERRAACRMLVAAGESELALDLAAAGWEGNEGALYEAQVMALIHRGRLAEARTEIADHWLGPHLLRLPLIRLELGFDPVRDTSPTNGRWSLFRAVRDVRNGDVAAARARIAEFPDYFRGSPAIRRLIDWVEAEIAWAGGDRETALARIDRAAPRRGETETEEVALVAGTLVQRAARMNREAGRRAEAEAWCRRFEDEPGLLRFAAIIPGFWMPEIRSWYDLGRCREEAGDETGALELYRRFLSCWSEPDEGFPEIADALARFERLAGTPWTGTDPED